ncbi:hypothetical protein [Microbispora sp. H10670]|nr:hypothetical protein [Microbispora sp. H10670]
MSDRRLVPAYAGEFPDEAPAGRRRCRTPVPGSGFLKGRGRGG